MIIITSSHDSEFKSTTAHIQFYLHTLLLIEEVHSLIPIMSGPLFSPQCTYAYVISLFPFHLGS
jgi:hypothetical protein